MMYNAFLDNQNDDYPLLGVWLKEDTFGNPRSCIGFENDRFESSGWTFEVLSFDTIEEVDSLLEQAGWTHRDTWSQDLWLCKAR